MIPVPAGWLADANRTHAPRWRAVVQRRVGGQLVDSVEAHLVGGSLRHDGTRWPRISAGLVLPASGLPAVAPRHLLPYGTRVRLEYRITGDWALIAEPHVVRSVLNRPQGLWDLEAVDGSGLIQEDTINARRPAALTGSIGDVVAGLIRRTLPDATVTVAGPAATSQVPADWRADPDPWRCIEQLTDLAGSEVAVLPGPHNYAVRPIPDLADPVDRLAVKENLTGYAIGHERAYNAVAAEYYAPGQSSAAAAVTGWWTDDRPDSVLNPQNLGHHVTLSRRYEGTPTQAQADAAAAAIGAREAGRARSVSVEGVPRPWIEPGDTVEVAFSGGPVERQLVTAVEIPFDGRAMRVTARNTRYVAEQEL